MSVMFLDYPDELLNKEKINKDEIVYFLRRSGNKIKICYGIVDDIYSDGAFISLLQPKDLRMFEGVPVKEWEGDGRKRKLPKGWTYKTRLVEYTYPDNADELNERFKNVDTTHLDELRKAMNEGLFVRVKESGHWYIDEDIQKDGYYLRKKCYEPCSYGIEYTPNDIVVPYPIVYHSYVDALAVKEAYEKEQKRQASLSDREWSIEQIEHTIDRYCGLYQLSDIDKEKYRERLLGLDHIEDIETRICYGHIQYKHWKHKRWNTIEII